MSTVILVLGGICFKIVSCSLNWSQTLYSRGWLRIADHSVSFSGVLGLQVSNPMPGSLCVCLKKKENTIGV